MIELSIIHEQIALLSEKSKLRALDTDEVRRLESLVRSKVLLLGNSDALPADENPFGELSPEVLKLMLSQAKPAGDSDVS